MPELRNGKRTRGDTPDRDTPRKRLNEHAAETSQTSRDERAARRAEIAEACQPPLPDVGERLAEEVAARQRAEQAARVAAAAQSRAEQSARAAAAAQSRAEQAMRTEAAARFSAEQTARMAAAARDVEREQTNSLQRSVADLQRRLTAETTARQSAERRLSALDGFEFEDGHWGSGNWRPILDQNAVQLLRTLSNHQSVRYSIGPNHYCASMSYLGEITQRNEHYSTPRRVRKTGPQQPVAAPPPRPWYESAVSPLQAPRARVTDRWLALAGSWSTEDAVRQLFLRRCGHALQLESVAAVCHEASLNAFRVGSLDANADPSPHILSDALLFHGTRTDGNVANILAEGLKLRFANASGMLGGGIYGAPDPRKSAQYAPQSEHGKFLFLCRFNLTGNVRHHQNVQFAEYCVYEESKVAVLWMLKIR